MALKEGLRTKRIIWRLILLALGLLGLFLYGLPRIRYLEIYIPMGVCPSAIMSLLRDNFTGVLHPWARPEVLTCTSWGAPIIWDGTFNPDIAQQVAGQQNLTIGLTVFAVGRYWVLIELRVSNMLSKQSTTSATPEVLELFERDNAC
jgi:hypothetical protein